MRAGEITQKRRTAHAANQRTNDAYAAPMNGNPKTIWGECGEIGAVRKKAD